MTAQRSEAVLFLRTPPHVTLEAGSLTLEFGRN
jgi:hypothetical protein